MEDQKQNALIERLVIAGNSLSAETRDKKILSTAKYLTTGQAALSVNAVNTLDDILNDFSGGLEVDIMPGANDPANQNMPQQPLHLCLFPSMKKIFNFNSFQAKYSTYFGVNNLPIPAIVYYINTLDVISVGGAGAYQQSCAILYYVM